MKYYICIHTPKGAVALIKVPEEAWYQVLVEFRFNSKLLASDYYWTSRRVDSEGTCYQSVDLYSVKIPKIFQLGRPFTFSREKSL